jgi:hypothetical protein
LGWPIREAQVSKSSTVFDVVQAEQKQSHLADSKLKKMCSKNSSLLFVWFLRNLVNFKLLGVVSATTWAPWGGGQPPPKWPSQFF